MRVLLAFCVLLPLASAARAQVIILDPGPAVEQEPDPVILTSKRPARAIGPLSSEEQQFSARMLGLESVAEVGRHGVAGFLQPYEGADKRALSVEELLARTDPRWERDYRRKRTTRTALALLAVASVVSGVVTLWLGAHGRCNRSRAESEARSSSSDPVEGGEADRGARPRDDARDVRALVLTRFHGCLGRVEASGTARCARRAGGGSRERGCCRAGAARARPLE
jgi:hypothetical protein